MPRDFSRPSQPFHRPVRGGRRSRGLPCEEHRPLQGAFAPRRRSLAGGRPSVPEDSWYLMNRTPSPQKTLQEKPFLPQGFSSSFSLSFAFPFPFCSLKQNQTPLLVNSTLLEVLRPAVLCTALNGGVRKREHHFIFAA